jgi:hypothetical protein
MKDSSEANARFGLEEAALRKAWKQPAMSRLPLKDAATNHLSPQNDGTANKS